MSVAVSVHIWCMRNTLMVRDECQRNTEAAAILSLHRRSSEVEKIGSLRQDSLTLQQRHSGDVYIVLAQPNLSAREVGNALDCMSRLARSYALTYL